MVSEFFSCQVTLGSLSDIFFYVNVPAVTKTSAKLLKPVHALEIIK